MSTGDGIVVFLEAVALIVWVILALGYDQRIKRWEDRTARRIKRWPRRIRRWLCERWMNQGFEVVRGVRMPPPTGRK